MDIDLAGLHGLQSRSEQTTCAVLSLKKTGTRRAEAFSINVIKLETDGF